MSIKDVLNYKVETNSTGMRQPGPRVEEDMDRQLAEMRRGNLRRTPPSAPSQPLKPLSRPARPGREKTLRTEDMMDDSLTETMSPVREKPVRERPVREKPVKEKPVREKPVKEKASGDKKGLFGHNKKKNAEVFNEDTDQGTDELFNDVESEEDGDVIFSEEEMNSSMDDLFAEEDPDIREIKDMEVNDISELPPAEEHFEEPEEPPAVNTRPPVMNAKPQKRREAPVNTDETPAPYREETPKRRPERRVTTVKRSDVFDEDGMDDEETFPDRNQDEELENTLTGADRTQVLRREIERNASGAGMMPEGELPEAAAPQSVYEEESVPPAAERRPAPAAPAVPVQTAPEGVRRPQPARPVRRPGGDVPPAGSLRAQQDMASSPENIDYTAPNPSLQRRQERTVNGNTAPVPRPGAAADRRRPAPANAASQPQGAPQGAARPVRGERPSRPSANIPANANRVPANTNVVQRTPAPAARPVNRSTAVEKKKEEGRREFESRRRNVSSDQFEAEAFPLQIISYVAVAIIVIVALVCAFKKVELNELSPLILAIVSVIMVIMGIFLGSIPAFITLIIAAISMVAGALTGFFTEVICALVVLLATVTALKGRKK